LNQGGGGPNRALVATWQGFRDPSTFLIENIPQWDDHETP
jgi:hypothetical protein